MEPARQKWTARLLLVLAVGLGLAWLSRLDFSRKISTDVLDLIPSSERAPELALARTLAGEEQAKVAFFVLTGGDGAERGRAADAFVTALRGSPAFAEAVRMPDTAGRDALGKYLFDHRFDLLLPGWLAERHAAYVAAHPAQSWPDWLAESTAADLERFLAKPEAMAFQDLVPSDPLLLMPRLVDRVRGFEDQVAPTARELVWARTSAPPLSEAGQQPVFAAVDSAIAAAQKIAPGVRVEWTSIGRFAAENRHRIEHEMSSLNLVSLAAVLAVAALCLRHVTKALHLIPVVLGALLGAWVGTTLVFDRVHVLVFVIGSLLGGVAIDYGFYLFLQPPLFPGEPYAGKVRRLLKPLLASALTTVLGFSLLLFSELPLIRQLGVFVSAGLIAALAAALLWFAQRDETFTGTRAFARARISGDRPGVRRAARVLLAIGGIVAVLGPWRLHWRDDIQDLEALPPGFREEATAIRAQFGERADRATYLTRGDTPAAAREALERFLACHARQFPGTAIATLGLAVPTPAEWEGVPGEISALAGFEPAFRVALARHGFEADAFAPFFTAWREWQAAPRPAYDALVTGLQQSLRGPLALTMSSGRAGTWFVTVATHAPGAEPPGDAGTIGLDQLQSFNRLFSRYRISALQLSAIGLVLLGLSVLALYGVRRGLTIFAVPAGSCLFALGLLGLVGQTMNLFHLLGAFLGVCLSHNYAIFSAENAARGDEPPPSIRLSALTTGASFGVLAFSRIAVVSALGTTVALIVLTALAVVELKPLAGKQGAATREPRRGADDLS